jgi:hypothetical protein
VVRFRIARDRLRVHGIDEHGIVRDEARSETLHAASDLTSWLTGRFPEVVDRATDRDLIDARALRGSLARCVDAQPS